MEKYEVNSNANTFIILSFFGLIKRIYCYNLSRNLIYKQTLTNPITLIINSRNKYLRRLHFFMSNNIIDLIAALFLGIIVFSRMRAPKKPPPWWKSFRLYTTYAFVLLVLLRVYNTLS